MNIDEEVAFIIDNKKFPDTKGLYDLIFKRNPSHYTQQDAELYKGLLELTSAHKRGFNPNAQNQGTKLDKYRTIIRPMFPPVVAAPAASGVGRQVNCTNYN